jgi:hypothetical protein
VAGFVHRLFAKWVALYQGDTSRFQLVKERQMNDDELLNSLRMRRENEARRIDMTTIPTPPLFPVASPALIELCEADLGRRLPTLLKRIFLEVGNGGFGPAGGLIGISEGYADLDGCSLQERYCRLMPEGWHPELLPLFDWGGGTWSTVDTSDSKAMVVTADSFGYTTTVFSLSLWLSKWLDNVDLYSEIYEFEDVQIINPFNKQMINTRKIVAARGNKPARFNKPVTNPSAVDER